MLSSGTVGAAIEGALASVPSIAVSLCSTRARGIDYCSAQAEPLFASAAEIACRSLALVHGTNWSAGRPQILSINVPFNATVDTPVEVAAPQLGGYGNAFAVERGTWLHVGAPVEYQDAALGTDVRAIAEGRVAVTPINLRLVDDKELGSLRRILHETW